MPSAEVSRKYLGARYGLRLRLSGGLGKNVCAPLIGSYTHISEPLSASGLFFIFMRARATRPRRDATGLYLLRSVTALRDKNCRTCLWQKERAGPVVGWRRARGFLASSQR
jgi:hypothetical protein